ncbi:MAG: hypothetical protein MUF42_07370 [Cytophagaceae bacterium]|nr:hypothetical protein [Cytophagaceae bacterium]
MRTVTASLLMNNSLEQILEKQNLEIERKNRALDQYAYINAHQLRAPIARIIGLVELCSHLELSDEGKEIIARMKSESKELDLVVRNISKLIHEADKPGK